MILPLVLSRTEDGESSVKEWCLIELQGILEADGTLAGQELGELQLEEDGTKVLLTIGSHLLEGEVKNLAKPLMVARKAGGSFGLGPSEKRQRTAHAEELEAEPECDELKTASSCDKRNNEPVNEEMPKHEESESTPGFDTGAEYEVVSIVRKQCLFKSRPKPIVTKI